MVDFVVGGIITGLNNIVGLLGQALTHVVEIVQSTLTRLDTRLKSILTSIKNILQTPITEALKKVTDTFLNPAITSLQQAYLNITNRLQTAISNLQATANTQFAAYLQKLTDIAADGVNLVTGLAADLNTLLENAIGNNVIYCTEQYGPAIQAYATNFITTYSECIEEAAVNATGLIDSALAIANVTLGQAEALIKEFNDCVAPTLADPRNSSKKQAAVACVGDLIDSAIVDGTVLVNTVNSASSDLVSALILAGSEGLRCVNYKNTDAILGAQFIEQSILKCLAA